MAGVLNRLGFRLRKVVNAKPQKKSKQTDAIFDKIQNKRRKRPRPGQRGSLACKATVDMGDVSRGGLTRGDHRACDHDLGLQEKYIPCGIVDEERANAYHRWEFL